MGSRPWKQQAQLAGGTLPSLCPGRREGQALSPWSWPEQPSFLSRCRAPGPAQPTRCQHPMLGAGTLGPRHTQANVHPPKEVSGCEVCLDLWAGPMWSWPPIQSHNCDRCPGSWPAPTRPAQPSVSSPSKIWSPTPFSSKTFSGCPPILPEWTKCTWPRSPGLAPACVPHESSASPVLASRTGALGVWGSSPDVGRSHPWGPGRGHTQQAGSLQEALWWLSGLITAPAKPTVKEEDGSQGEGSATAPPPLARQDLGQRIRRK